MHHSRSSGSRIREQSPHGRCPAFSGFPNDRLSPTGSGLNAHSDGYPRGAARLPRGIIPVPLFTRMPDGVAPRRCVHTVSASRIFSSCRTGFVRTTLIIDHAGAPVKHRNPYFFSECGNTHRNGLDKKIGPKWEKWLDNRAFQVYTALVSHNGLVRQKGSFGSVGPRGRHEKFVKNAELPRRIRVDLCASAQI